jgi:predicted RecB family nuclease
MGTSRGARRTCDRGHVYYKRSDCPTCPQCEAERRPADGFLTTLVAPARRALEGAGIATLAQLASWSEAELLALHGLGPSSLPKLRAALAAAGLSFRAQ